MVRASLDRETHMMTDEAIHYGCVGAEFERHDTVRHSRGEYGHPERKTKTKVDTNTVEGAR